MLLVTLIAVALWMLSRMRPRDSLSDRVVIVTTEASANRAWARLGASWLSVAPEALPPVYEDAINALRALGGEPPLSDAQTRELAAWRALCEGAWHEARYVLWLPGVARCPWDMPRRLRALLDTACRWSDWQALRAAPGVWLFAPGAIRRLRVHLLRTEHTPEALCAAELRMHPASVTASAPTSADRIASSITP